MRPLMASHLWKEFLGSGDPRLHGCCGVLLQQERRAKRTEARHVHTGWKDSTERGEPQDELRWLHEQKLAESANLRRGTRGTMRFKVYCSMFIIEQVVGSGTGVAVRGRVGCSRSCAGCSPVFRGKFEAGLQGGVRRSA